MTRLPIHLLFALLVLAAVALAGGDAPPEPVDCTDPGSVETTVSFSSDVLPIFSFNCVICHQTGAANANLILETGKAYENLVAVESTQSDLLRVKPGDPSASYLNHKLMGTQMEVGGTGAQMPLGLGALPATDLDTIATWIQQCAPNN